jgi:hypothetical protein
MTARGKSPAGPRFTGSLAAGRGAGTVSVLRLPLADLVEGAALDLPHLLPRQTQPTADLRERQAFTLQAEAEHQDVALAPVALPNEPPCNGAHILGIHPSSGPSCRAITTPDRPSRSPLP